MGVPSELGSPFGDSSALGSEFGGINSEFSLIVETSESGISVLEVAVETASLFTEAAALLDFLDRDDPDLGPPGSWRHNADVADLGGST